MIKKIINSNINLFIITILLIIFSLPIIINSTPNNKDINELHSFVTKITYYNNTVCDSLNLQSEDVDCYDSLLNNSINKLKKLSKVVKKVNLTTSKEPIRTEILTTISNNISLYETSLYLIMNPNSSNCSEKLIEFEETVTSIKNSYNNLNSLGLKCIYPKSINAIFKNTSSYVNNIILSNLNKDIKSAQLKDFYRSIDTCLNLLNDISEDLEPALIKIREDDRSLDVLLLDIKNKKITLSSIKTNISLLSIPTEGNEIYKQLKSIIDEYDLYINSLQYSIEVEQSSPTSTIIADNYNSSFTKYNNYMTSFKEFKTKLDNFNKNSI